MIPPSMLNASFLFTLVPIWEQEQVPPAPCQAPATDGDEPTASESGAAPSGQPAGDADGTNDQVALRMVLKGYKLAVVPSWAAEANPGYERWVEGRSDDDAERQEQRARAGTRPKPPVASSEPAADSAPPASCDGRE